MSKGLIAVCSCVLLLSGCFEGSSGSGGRLGDDAGVEDAFGAEDTGGDATSSDAADADGLDAEDAHRDASHTSDTGPEDTGNDATDTRGADATGDAERVDASGDTSAGADTATDTGADTGADTGCTNCPDPGTAHWSRLIAGARSEGVNALAVDSADNVFMAGDFTEDIDPGGGSLTSADYFDIFLAKTDKDGNHLWSKRFGGTKRDDPEDIAVDSQGAVLMVGYYQGSITLGADTHTTTTRGAFLVKLDANGAYEWHKNFGCGWSKEAHGVAVDSQDNIIVVGWMTGSCDFGGGDIDAAGWTDVFVAKYDSSGNHLWSKRFGDTGGEDAQAVAIDSSDNIFVTGGFSDTVDFGGGDLTSAGHQDVFVLQLDSNGDHIWSDGFGDYIDDLGQNIAVDSQDRVVISGLFHRAIDFGGGPRTSDGRYDGPSDADIFVAQFLTTGAQPTHAWSTAFGNQSNAWLPRTAVDAHDNVISTGGFLDSVDFGGGPLTNPHVTDTDIFVLKQDSSGAHQWSVRYGNINGDWGTAIAAGSAGQIFVAGEFRGEIDFGQGGITGLYSSGDAFLVSLAP